MSIEHPAFADAVHGAQACFRAVLDAMSRPGTVHAAGEGLAPPAPLDPSTAAVLLTLVDAETGLAVAAPFAPAADWIAFHCGAPAAGIAEAAFVLASALPDLATLHAGSDEGPEEGATVILQVRGFDGLKSFRLTGPGIETDAVLAVDGLPDYFAERWQANRAAFPRGVDLVLCAGNRLAALPRSVMLEAI